MTQTSELEKRTLRLTRQFDAPLQLVWRAWTESGHISNWWGPPGMQTTIKKHNFTEGGEWEFVMPMPNGGEFVSHGVYVRIIPESLIETSANFIPMTEGVTLVARFKAAGDQTEFIFEVIHPTEEYCKQQEEMGFYNGWGSTFDRLNAFLKGQPT